MIRLVLIVGNEYAVYEGKQRIAFYKIDDEGSTPLTLDELKQEIEFIRTQNYAKA